MKYINLLRLICSIAATGALLFVGNAQATVTGLTAVTGGVNNDRMVSDSVLNVTWTDIALAGSWSGYNGPQITINSLNLQNYGGYNDWRLPTGYGNTPNQDLCSPGSDHELGCLFINELGNTAGVAADNFSPFSTLTDQLISPYFSHYYGWSDQKFWSSSVSALMGGLHNTCVGACNPTVWYFDINTGSAEYDYDDMYGGQEYRILAVRTGQTLDAPPPVTPIPATVWLLLSSIGGLGVFARKRKA